MNRNSKFIPFALPSIGKQEITAVKKVLKSGWLTTGSVTKKFEENFAEYTGTKHALAVNSATSGLHLALAALGIKEGDSVITTPYTFVASAEVIRYCNAAPIFADIDQDDLNINPDEIERAIQNNKQKKIKAIIPVHIAGFPCKMKEITGISEKYNLPVVEDAAHAFPVLYKNKFAGTIGKLGVYSFYTTKPLATGEGGMIATDDDDLAKRISIMRLHGIDREAWNRYTSKTPGWEYDIIDVGFKYNLTDIASAIGIEQLKKSRALKEKRRIIAERYLAEFKNYDFLNLPKKEEDHAWHLFILRLNPEKLKITRNEYIEKLFEEGIGISVHYKPLHLMTYYKNNYGFKPEDFPNSLSVFQNCLSLPIYPDLKQNQIDRIIKSVIKTGKENYKAKCL